MQAQQKAHVTVGETEGAGVYTSCVNVTIQLTAFGRKQERWDVEGVAHQTTDKSQQFSKTWQVL